MGAYAVRLHHFVLLSSSSLHFNEQAILPFLRSHNSKNDSTAITAPQLAHVICSLLISPSLERAVCGYDFIVGGGAGLGTERSPVPDVRRVLGAYPADAAETFV